MKFGEALELIKNGHKVCRNGWNGKHMFIYMQEGSVVPVVNMKQTVTNHLFGDMLLECDTTVEINPHIDMRTADGTLTIGWNPSQVDMFSEDWMVAE